jgi:hypothetical protein
VGTLLPEVFMFSSYNLVFFSRYLQERLKQLHEEVSLLKSNIAKYKVQSLDNAGDSPPYI